MFGRNYEPKIAVECEPSKSKLMDSINKLSSALLEFIGINYDNAINGVSSGKFKYFMPSFNEKGQINMSISTYIGLDRDVQKRLRKLNMVSIITDSKDILDLIDEVEESKKNEDE